MMKKEYHIIYEKDIYKDLKRIKKLLDKKHYDNVKEEFDNKIEQLKSMPRMHKTLYFYNDSKSEYRRILSGKYIIIYKIENKDIIILRIFNQRENYLNQNQFILKEKSINYKIN